GLPGVARTGASAAGAVSVGPGAASAGAVTVAGGAVTAPRAIMSMLTAGATAFAGLPSKACALTALNASAEIEAIRSDVRIALSFRCAAGMRDGAVTGVADLLRVLPEIAGFEFMRPRLPRGLALVEFRGRQIHAEDALGGIDRDYIAVLEKTDRPADCRFGADVADAEAARRA